MANGMLAATEKGPRWTHVVAFLALTFGLTWALNLAIYLRGGLQTPGLLVGLQLQMLLPAAVATVLGLFFFREHPLNAGKAAGRGRWFYYFFLVLTAVFALGTLAAWFDPSPDTLTTVAASTQLLAMFGLVLLIVLRLVRGGRESMARVWLRWGHWRYWLLFSASIIAYYGLQTMLNVYFDLGKPAEATGELMRQTGLSGESFYVAMAIQMLLVGPFLGTVIAFGEEYGWRGYLQSELLKLGRVRGIVLLGVIWGLWHAPVILMGYNYPGQPILGVLMMTIYTTGLAFWLGYAVLKSGSIILAAFLHALNNQAASFFLGMVNTPRDMTFSFGIGIYGVVILVIAVLLILRDPIWRETGSNLPEATATPAAQV
ncbi:MAG: CPBP family intramembrane glutamic endopeptidase [Chloroflexota bacterium]